MHKCDVVVLGAGVSGLIAALELARGGINITLVEARDRVGGRIFTRRPGALSLPVELGAEFIHGRPRVLWDVIEAAGLPTWELGGAFYCVEDNSLSECAFEEGWKVVEDLKNYRGADIPFGRYLAERNEGTAAPWASSYVEGFNAADQSIIGVASLAKQQAAEDAIEGARIFRIRSGYQQLPEFLLEGFLGAGGVLRKKFEVKEIQWQKGSVTVAGVGTHDSPEPMTARAAIVALPLGVLQAGNVRFDPYPKEIFVHLRRLAFGNVHRVTLEFDDCFWNEGRDEPISFLFSLNSMPPTWWTPSPLPAPLITGWVGGPKAEDPRLDDEAFMTEQSLATLSRLLSVDPRRLRARFRRSYTHNWRKDPYACGAYTYIPAGAMNAAEQLARSVDNTLFFAGEHTDTTGHWGTVHGAMASGIRVARDVMAII